MEFEEFSRGLVETGDLDPVYIAAREAGMNNGRLLRWLASYMMFYHVGMACWHSQFTGPDFWEVAMRAAQNKVAAPVGERWPRAPERRHFRGAFAERTVRLLQDQFPRPEDLFGRFRTAKTGAEVRARMGDVPGFGFWASFKSMDLVDRVMGVPLEVTLEEAMYEVPLTSAVMIHRSRTGQEAADPEDAVLFSIGLLGEAGVLEMKAPPALERPLGLLEIETCLCKFKSHAKGRYPIGKDAKETFEHAEKWARVDEVASKMADSLGTIYERARRWKSA